MFFTDTRKGNLRSCSGSKETMFALKTSQFPPHCWAYLPFSFTAHIHNGFLFVCLLLFFLAFLLNCWFGLCFHLISFLLYLCHVKQCDSLSRFFIVYVNDCPLCSGGLLHTHFWKVCWCFWVCCADLWSKTENGVVIFQVVIKCWVFFCCLIQPT